MPNPEDTTIFKDRFDHIVKENLTPSNRRELVSHIARTLSKPHIAQGIDVVAPVMPIYLGDESTKDRGEIVRLSGLNLKDLRQAYADVPYFEAHWQIHRNPFNWVIVLILRRMVLDRARERDVEIVAYFMLVHFAASIISGKFFKFKPNENIVNYAVNTMSNKFLLKSYGSFRRVLEHFASTSHKRYKVLLIEGTDSSLMKYFLNLRTKLNSMLRGFKSHFENIKTQGNYLNFSKDFYDDGKMVDRESHFGIIESLAQQTAHRFVSEPLSYKMLGQSARISGITMTNLRTILESARSSERRMVQDIITKIIELFFEEQKGTRTEINTRKFSNYYLSVYLRSNTKDQRVKEIKEKLNDILIKHGALYRKTEREATKNNYRKAAYIYFCMLLQSLTRGN